MNKIIIISGLALALALITGFKRLNSASASQFQTPERSMPTREARVLGLIDERAGDTLTAPETVSVGEDFQVTITTIGGGCERAGDTGLILADDSAAVLVYDFTTATRPGVACTRILKRMPHTVTLRFTKPGEALIRVWGRRGGADTPPLGVPTVLERRVLVK